MERGRDKDKLPLDLEYVPFRLFFWIIVFALVLTYLTNPGDEFDHIRPQQVVETEEPDGEDGEDAKDESN
ncbi:hypothetical protein FZEAL_7248 [Fusarium zealandicum]|uniref:Uncharacterized protein n=1 Tax=Fusarium zealandicum TaxID=1053134 RepID=A0A8H4UGB9_9HYPO|nr:hypothetical protein FZEAL_7248 [Fusarium zealandicum]